MHLILLAISWVVDKMTCCCSEKEVVPLHQRTCAMPKRQTKPDKVIFKHFHKCFNQNRIVVK